MLVELQYVRQGGGLRRRWFQSPTEDLIVWYSADGAIWGFQFCYDRGATEKALTWRPEGGFSHERVDDGEGPSLTYKRTPVLVADGAYDAGRLAELFQGIATAVPRPIVEFVLERLRGDKHG